jgi:hypothetical protein
MADIETDTQESFAPLGELLADRSDATATTRTLSVLEELEAGLRLRDRPTSVLCPGCGETVARFEDGLPNYLAHFNGECSTCGIEFLQRWSVIAVPTAHADVFSTARLAETVQNYWDRKMWPGIETSSECYKTDEFTTAFNDRAEAYGWDWRVSCPLCRRTLEEAGASRLDYHHWTHSPDRGVCLCRDCHDAIGAGEFDNALDDRAREIGLRSGTDLQIARLAAREHLVETYGATEPLARTLVERYDLPRSPETVECIIRQALGNEDVRAAMDDHHLRKGLDGVDPDG